MNRRSPLDAVTARRGRGGRETPAPSSSPKPGAFEATRQGCTCSGILNFFGRGFGNPRWPLFTIAPNCPLHKAAGSGSQIVTDPPGTPTPSRA